MKLFLSLTALQFLINEQLPRSSYPSAITKLVLVCYVVVAFGVPETIVVYAIARSGAVKEEMEQSARKLQKLDNDKMDNLDLDESQPSAPSNMSLALKVFKRKKSGKVAFVIDMISLVVVFITIIISTVLTLNGF